MHCTFAYSMFVLLLSARMHAMHICSCWQTPDFCLLFVVNKLAKKYATKTRSLWQQSVFVLRPFLTTTLVMSWWPVNLTSWICGTSQKSLDAPAVWGSRTRQHRSAEKNSIVQNTFILVLMCICSSHMIHVRKNWWTLGNLVIVSFTYNDTMIKNNMLS